MTPDVTLYTVSAIGSEMLVVCAVVAVVALVLWRGRRRGWIS